MIILIPTWHKHVQWLLVKIFWIYHYFSILSDLGDEESPSRIYWPTQRDKKFCEGPKFKKKKKSINNADIRGKAYLSYLAVAKSTERLKDSRQKVEDLDFHI